MGAMIRPVSIIVLVISFSYIFLGSCQQGSPQNIETFYPSAPPPSGIPLPPPSPPPATVPSPPSLPLPPPPPITTGSPSSENNKTIVKAVIGTAAGSIAISALLIVLVRRHSRKKLEDKSAGGLAALARDDFTRFDRNIKGLIVDENGLDVLYWRNLQSGKARNGFRREVMKDNEEGGRDVMAAITNGSQRGNSDPIQEVSLLREKHTSNFNRDVEMSLSSGQQPFTSPRRRLTPRTTGTTSPEQEVRTALAIPGIKSHTPSPPPPPPPPVTKASNARAPPPPTHGTTSSPEPEVRTASAIPGVKNERPSPPPPPPMPKAGNARPPPTPLPNGKPGDQSGKNHIETGQVKMKPLHWDKVNANADHSMVWNKIGHGSFK